MTNEPGTVELSTQDLRVVARYAAESAQEVLSIFEERHPDDRRPRAAVEAAWTFAAGAERTKLQRTSALAAHKAAQEATSEATREAARAAGDAAAAAYLHPLPKATQVKHILGAAAHAARAAELVAGGDHRGRLTLPEHRERFRWLHEPPRWQLTDALELTTAPDSDYWQRTHYGFRRDNGHFFWTPVHGDFALSARLTSTPNAQYDQCGLLVRADSEAWVKCSAEFETPTHSRLGSVVTNHGYSDWATQDIAGAVTDLWYRLRRAGDDVFIDWSEDGAAWRQMRVAHLHNCPAELLVGVYACSPTGPGFTCTVSDMVLETADEADQQGATDA